MTRRAGKDPAEAGYRHLDAPLSLPVRYRQAALLQLLSERTGHTEDEVAAIALAKGLRQWADAAGISLRQQNQRDELLRDQARAVGAEGEHDADVTRQSTVPARLPGTAAPAST